MRNCTRKVNKYLKLTLVFLLLDIHLRGGFKRQQQAQISQS